MVAGGVVTAAACREEGRVRARPAAGRRDVRGSVRDHAYGHAGSTIPVHERSCQLPRGTGRATGGPGACPGIRILASAEAITPPPAGAAGAAPAAGAADAA